MAAQVMAKSRVKKVVIGINYLIKIKMIPSRMAKIAGFGWHWPCSLALTYGRNTTERFQYRQLTLAKP